MKRLEQEPKATLYKDGQTFLSNQQNEFITMMRVYYSSTRLADIYKTDIIKNEVYNTDMKCKEKVHTPLAGV